MKLQEASQRAAEIWSLFAIYEQQTYGREWTTQEIMLGFMVDVGDLTKLVQAANGVRKVDGLHEKLEHELADCLWSILVLANKLDIDIESAFVTTMEDLENKLGNTNE